MKSVFNYFLPIICGAVGWQKATVCLRNICTKSKSFYNFANHSLLALIKWVEGWLLISEKGRWSGPSWQCWGISDQMLNCLLWSPVPSRVSLLCFHPEVHQSWEGGDGGDLCAGFLLIWGQPPVLSALSLLSGEVVDPPLCNAGTLCGPLKGTA